MPGAVCWNFFVVGPTKTFSTVDVSFFLLLGLGVLVVAQPLSLFSLSLSSPSIKLLLEFCEEGEKANVCPSKHAVVSLGLPL